MPKIAMYSRVSTEDEKQTTALQTQIQENREFIEKQPGWELYESYIDEGKSGTSIEGRSDFKRLLADMQTNKFDIVLIKILDRGWRSSYDWKVFERLLITTGKQLFIRSRNAFYDFQNPSDYMLGLTLSYLMFSLPGIVLYSILGYFENVFTLTDVLALAGILALLVVSTSSISFIAPDQFHDPAGSLVIRNQGIQAYGPQGVTGDLSDGNICTIGAEETNVGSDGFSAT